MNKFSRTTRSVTFAAMCGLALTTGAVGVYATTDFAPAAVAQSVSSPLVDKNAQGTLTLHKKADPSDTGTPTGNEDSGVQGTPLEGVGFTVYKVKNVDLTTNDGIAKVAGLKASDLVENGKANLSKVEQINGEKLTQSNGEAKWENLAPSAYLVVETAPKDGYAPAAPFLAFVPMTQSNAEAGGTEWNYDVHAYPKNYASKTPEKSVEDSGKNVGDKIDYTITAYAQTVKENQVRTIFRVEDTLDPKLTAPQPNEVTVDGFESADYKVSVEGQKVTVAFTEAGLAKLKDNQPVSVHIPATVKEQPENGAIVNTAQVFENNPNTGEEQTPKETPTVNTYYGGVKFTKVSASDVTKGLADAEFKVFGVKDDQTCDKASTDGKTPVLTQLKVNNADVYKSAADGLVTIDGLHVNDYANATEGTANLYSSYCLVETKSPKGFELLAEPIEFKVLKADVETQQAEKVIRLLSEVGEGGKLKNLEDTTPNLPMTGGAGIGILAALGALIIGAGAWLARRNSAKN